MYSKELLAELNQRLSGKKADPDIVVGEFEAETPEDENAYPVEFEKLKKFVTKEFGKESFVKPEKENDEIICFYVSREAYEEHANFLSCDETQSWLAENGFAFVSKAAESDKVLKIYFTGAQITTDDSENKKVPKVR